MPHLPASHVDPKSTHREGDAQLLEWVNSHLPPTCSERATDLGTSFISGKLISRLIEHIQNRNSTSEIGISPDEHFVPVGHEPNLEGLFAMMDKCIDEGVDTVGVSINDVRLGHVDETRKLVESLKTWGEARRV